MTVSIAKRRIEGTSGLSEPGRLTLKFVKLGPEWLDWAIQNRRVNYRFEDEAGLVSGMQEGLHAGSLVLLPAVALQISPLVLMGLHIDEIRLLARAERPGADPNAIKLAKAMLRKRGISVQTDLDMGRQLLRRLGVYQLPLFQTLTLADQLVLRELAGVPRYADLPAPNLTEEAAARAESAAQTPIEFADYYRAYIDLVEILGLEAEDASTREAAWYDALETLRPLLFNAIDCPRVDGPAEPWQVAQAIDEWLMMGRRLGFARLSLAIQQVISQAPYRGEEGDEAEQVVAGYLAAIQALMMNAELDQGVLLQDGTTRIFRLSSAGAQAEVTLAANGTITLSSFRSTPLIPEQQPPTPKHRGHHGKG